MLFFLIQFLLQGSTIVEEVFYMVTSVRLSSEEQKLICKYAKLHNLSVSAFIRQAVIEHIEDECDCKLFEQALKEYREDPVTYTWEEVKKELNEIDEV